MSAAGALCGIDEGRIECTRAQREATLGWLGGIDSDKRSGATEFVLRVRGGNMSGPKFGTRALPKLSDSGGTDGISDSGASEQSGSRLSRCMGGMIESIESPEWVKAPAFVARPNPRRLRQLLRGGSREIIAQSKNFFHTAMIFGGCIEPHVCEDKRLPAPPNPHARATFDP
jgi:hypothetical protein